MIVLDVCAPVDREYLRVLCSRVRASLDGGSRVLICDVGSIVGPDAAVVEGLARLQLVARQAGGDMWVRGACHELRDLIGFMGLAAVLRVEPRC